MSTEKGNDKLADLLRFIDLMVRQTCRRAYYEHQIRSKPIREDKNSIYSIDHLKKVYDKPREHIYQLVKNPQKTLKGQRVDNPGPAQKKDSKFTKIEQKMLLDFVKKVQDQAPPKHFIWIDLQHYLFYAYRNFACPNPNPMPETLSAFFICEMKELLDCLRREDESQVWLRIFTLLREYCIFAQWHYSQNDEEHALMKFFCYYEAMLTAAKSLVPVFTDFEMDVIYRNYRVCWIDFNTFIFIRFFYESDRVKTRINECVRTKSSPGDSQDMFGLLAELKRLWAREQTRVSLVNQEGKLPENSPEAAKEKKIMAAHKKLLSATFWVDRSKEMKKFIDMPRLDQNLFDLLKDKQFFPEGPGLNKNGQCICEECLVSKYKGFLDTNDDFSVIATPERTTYCRRCKCILRLDHFHRHINDHIDDLNPPKDDTPKPSLARIITEKMDFAKLGNNAVNLSDVLNEKLRICENGTSHNEHLGKFRKNDMNATKMAFEKYLQTKKDKKDGEKNKNGRTLSLREELLANGFVKGLREENEKPPAPIITAEKLDETELKLREIHRYGHKPYTASRVKFNGTENGSPIIGGPQPEDLEVKKCDCTYCEVFGGAQKGAEPRDKLRVRMYRRRERRKENDNKQIFLTTDSSKVKANKVESRVPLPSSPSNMPSTLSESSEYSVATKDTKAMTDIRGLVNYIEGNTAKNKVELAEKKAAKKARQKEKREQERVEAIMEAQRKTEERARQEEARKRALERKEEEKKLEELKLKKRLKKRRQAEKRQAAEIQRNTIEETIPAMVTIKRVPGGENGVPSVTITLKGCTPDQDKLLTTLVEEPKIECKNKSTSNHINNNNLTQNKGPKKKKVVGKYNGQSVDKSTVPEPMLIAKDVKVTVAVDKDPIPVVTNSLDFIAEKPLKKPKTREVKREREPTEEEIKSLGNLRLPPGITITKVEGPVTNKNYLGSDSNKSSSVMGKSGVIVVDTEKLIQKTESDGLRFTKANKKKKKKNKKSTECPTTTETMEKPKMVTLRNPMFQQFQTQNLSNKPAVAIDESAPAAIFTSENGMVTIRSSRLQQSLDNGVGQQPNALPLGMPLIPNMLSEMTNFSNPNHYTPEPCVNGFDKSENEERNTVTTLDAQEILSGLPGIEITKIDKKSYNKNDEMEIDQSCQDAQVSIIPSNGDEFEDLEFGKDDDWLYDSVFKPRDVLEDDMDDEELELEAFKRFCQQSVPPKEKKVAHFNVADIVLKKKTDVKFS